MAEPVLPPSTAGTVLLDIGGEVGALVVLTPPSMAGAEPEISPLEHPGERTHSAVRERRNGADSQYAVVYPALHAGQYLLYDPAGRPLGPVTVRGAHVTEVAWAELAQAADPSSTTPSVEVDA